MDKVVLTSEQADAIDKYINDLSRSHWQQKVNKLRSEVFIDKCLLELSTDDFMHVFKHGYDLAPAFKPGDWVVRKEDGVVGQVTFYCPDEEIALAEKSAGGIISSSSRLLRHATKEEIKKEEENDQFHKQGREPWELKRGDVLVERKKNSLDATSYIFICTTVNKKVLNPKLEVLRLKYKLKFKESLSYIKENYKVVYFVEDKKS